MADKIIVGVHGMGDQVRYETTQSIANQFCRYYKIQTAVPLGRFHSSDANRNGIVEVELNNAAVSLNKFKNLYFTEVYWADVPRKPVTEGYTLEETKHWVKTIVERFRCTVRDNRISKFAKLNSDKLSLMNKKGKEDRVKVDYKMIKSVLYEAVDAIAIMEKLLKVTKMAGLLEFNLNSILTDFMGDVQIVTEFEKLRTEILNIFVSTVSRVHELNHDADIYVIAHSEGTVVAFLGLLEAMNQKCPWIKNVKGFMTLGSPIDKHLILWPELWKDYEGNKKENKEGVGNNLQDNQIKWLNYYDLGDPVGYDLDTARDWVEGNALVFDFNEKHDYGFSRYYLPGKAHVDYWQDDELFNHIIRSVVDVAQSKQGSKTPSHVVIKDKAPHPPKPPSKALAWVVSYIAPYLGAIALLFISVYCLYKPIHGVNEPALRLLRNVGGITAIIGGLTVMARIPRLTKRKRWLFIAGITFASFAFLSYIIFGEEGREIIDTNFCGKSYLYVAVAISVLVALISKKYATARTLPLIFLGGIAVLWPAFKIVLSHDSSKAVWPILLGGAIFLYGWWLSVLLFDLVFVWHRYICSSQALELLRATRRK